MFKNLTKFGYQRSPKEAIGFYIAYLAAIFLIGMILGAVGDLAIPGFTLDAALRMGNALAIVISLGLSFLILKEKKLLGNLGYMLIGLLGGVIAIFLGGLGGFIFVAYLTTRPSNTTATLQEN